MDCGIIMWIKWKQKLVKKPLLIDVKNNRVWHTGVFLTPQWTSTCWKNHLHLHPPNAKDWCVPRFTAFSAWEWNPPPLISQKLEQNHESPLEINATSSMQSIWGCTGERGGGVWTNLSESLVPPPTTTDALAWSHMCSLMTSTQHEDAVKIDAETWNVSWGEERGSLTRA